MTEESIRSSDRGSYYYHVGGLYRAQGNFEIAERSYQQAIVLEDRPTGDSETLAQSVAGLAVLYDLRNDSRTASTYNRFISLSKNFPEFHSTRGVYLELAQAQVQLVISSQLKRNNDYPNAEQLVLQAISIQEHLLGSDNIEISRSLFELSSIYEDQGKIEACETAYKRACLIKEGSVPKHEPTGLYTQHKLYKEAQRVRLIAQKNGDMSAAIWIDKLAGLYVTSKKKCEAAHLQALQDIKSVLQEHRQPGTRARR